MKRTVLLLSTIVAALLVPTGVAWAASVAFSQGQIVAVGDGPDPRPASVTSADFNGDSEGDLAVANIFSDNVSVLLGNGDGTFQAAQNFGAGDGPRDILSVDFNGDGDADLAVTNNAGGNNSANQVSVLLGNGDGTFGAPQSFAVGLSPERLTSGDFDGDGNADLATANPGSATPDPGGGFSYKVSVLLGNGDGTFQAVQNIPTGSCPYGITSADFNNDGYADLVTATKCVGGEGVWIHLGNGDGSFGAAQRFALEGFPSPRDIINVDFNDDGDQDVAVANDFGGDRGVYVLLGNGDGTFQADQSFVAGNGPFDLTSADFDGDAKADLAVANIFSDNVSVLLGNGDGTLQEAKNFGAGDGPGGLTNADFNDDAKPDLAVANVFSGNVSVLLNGDFTPPTINVPTDMTVDATSPNGEAVTYEVTVTDDGDPNPTLSCDPTSGSTFPIGTTIVECTATDSSGHSANASFYVVVRGAAEQIGSLRETVANLGLRTSLNRSLQAKLDDALAHVNAGRTVPACNKLSDFNSQVSAQSGKNIDSGYAEILTTDANRIKAVLGCK
jgi:hypothetical protein